MQQPGSYAETAGTGSSGHGGPCCLQGLDDMSQPGSGLQASRDTRSLLTQTVVQVTAADAGVGCVPG